ncbi:unnamed protein product [Rhizophagus irregularis]|nr:unnamed protein product [Rhizophagus irregularis]
MDLFQENNLVFAYEKETTDNTDSDNILLLRKEIIIPKCAPPILKKAIDKKTKYGMLWQSNNNTLINEEYEHHELKNIQNPLRIKPKGWPPTKRFKSSVEIEKSDHNANGGSSYMWG